MATGARKGLAGQGGGLAETDRSSPGGTPPPRGTSGKQGRSTTARSGQKKKGRGQAGKGRTAKGRTAKGGPSRRGRGGPARRPRDPGVILIGGIGRAGAGAWMVAAGSGGVAGRAGAPGAADPDPPRRRDGRGLLTLGRATVRPG